MLCYAKEPGDDGQSQAERGVSELQGRQVSCFHLKLEVCVPNKKDL
jgi:hypothetical protein